MSVLDKIKMAVQEASQFPNPTIDYNFELPEHSQITKDSFFGVKARFNDKVNSQLGYQVTYKLQ